MNKQEIDIVLKNCKESYNGYVSASGYDELTKILAYEFQKKSAIFDKIIELGPAYTLLPGFLIINDVAEYIGTDPFLYERTVHAIKYAHSSRESKIHGYTVYKKDALSFFQKFSELKGIIVSADVLNKSVIGVSDKNSEDNLIIDRYASELAKSIYDATPDTAFTAHIYIDDFFTEKLLEAGFKKKNKNLFSR